MGRAATERMSYQTTARRTSDRRRIGGLRPNPNRPKIGQISPGPVGAPCCLCVRWECRQPCVDRHSEEPAKPCRGRRYPHGIQYLAPMSDPLIRWAGAPAVVADNRTMNAIEAKSRSRRTPGIANVPLGPARMRSQTTYRFWDDHPLLSYFCELILILLRVYLGRSCQVAQRAMAIPNTTFCSSRGFANPRPCTPCRMMRQA